MDLPSNSRPFVQIKKSLSRISKTALLAFVFLILLVGNAKSVFATINNYTDLFTGTDPASELKLISLTKPVVGNATAVTTIPKFQFKSSFDLTAHNKEWHWEYIRDLDNPNVFVLRICDTANADENACYFSVVPYKSDMSDDENVFCSNNVCTLPTQGSPTPKIYHYAANRYADSNGDHLERADQNFRFSVLFDVSTLATLGTGTLNAPVSPNQVFHINDGKNYKADIWYCAGIVSGETLPTTDTAPNIRQFNNICGAGHPYFKIAESAVFKMPSSAAEALGQTPATVDQVDTSTTVSDGLPVCSLSIISPQLMGCVARAIYYVIYWPIAWFAGLMGTIFDFFLGYSLSDASYRADFAVKGWQLVRDMSNIFFIIILVWTGLSTVFNTGTNMKKVLPNLILNALLINFSLFGTRVVIDISNVVARVFYNSVNVCKGECARDGDGSITNFLTGPGGYKSLSTKIVSSFKPQTIFSASVLAKNAQVGNAQNTKTGTDPASDNAGYFIVVTLIAAALVFAIAMMFWKVSFMFLGRVVGLYIAMIFAPFAVLTKGNMPLVSGIKELGWDSWLKDLTNYALLAPIFVFFLYIIYSFLDSGFLKINFGDLGNADFFTKIISVAIPMLIVYFMMQQGVSIAKKYSGKIGERIQGYGEKLAGFAGGAAMGATALVGGRVIGAAATGLNESRIGSKLRDAAPNSKLARMTLQGLNTASAGSYDVRQTGIGKKLFKEMGINPNEGLKTMNTALRTVGVTGLDLSEEARKGGHLADEKRRQEDREKTAKLFEEKMSDDQIKEYNKKKREEYEGKVGGIINSDIAKRLNMNVFDVAKMKETNKIAYDLEVEKSKKETVVKDKVNKVEEPKEMKSGAELNSARRKDFADKLKSGAYTDRALTNIPLVGGFVGAVTGAGVRMRGDKKAAKKIEEKNKISTDLEKIESTIKNGFRDLIALEEHQDSAGFTALEQKEKDDILKYGSIQKGSGPKDREGKRMYDVLDAADQQEIDSKIKDLKTEQNKKEFERYEKMVEAIEGSRFNMKFINDDLKKLKKDMIDAIKTDAPNKETIKKEWIEKIEEKMRADAHNKIWSDVNKHREEQKKKLKGEDEAKAAGK